MYKFIVIASFITTVFLLNVQTSSAQDCNCSDLLQKLINNVQSNYAGYIHNVKENKDSSSYVELKKRTLKAAATTSFSDCYKVLTAYTDYFKDGHLFVIEFPRNSQQQSDSLRQLVKTIPLSEGRLRQLTMVKNSDPIEGVWKDEDQELLITKSSPNKFIGITISNTNSKWTRGMVKMEIQRTKTGEYFITIYRNDFAPVRFSKIRIYKNCMLPFGLYRFAKVSPVDPELKYVYPDNPQIPFYQKLDAKTVLLTVPTALISRHVLDSILIRHEKEIKSTDHLIIDLRGNLGGNGIWQSLVALANTKAYLPEKKKGVDEFLMLASSDNANYIKNNIADYIKDSVGTAYYANFIQQLRQNTGRFIGFSFYDPWLDTSRRPTYEFPKRVALITDRGTASAGEAFVLQMKRTSSKVVVYGDNTYGMIDYMNINTLKIDCGKNSTYYYGYPTFFSPSVKTTPINPTGIKPDRYVPKETIDWIEWVRKDLLK